MKAFKEKITTNEDADTLAKYAALNPYSAIPYHEEKTITTLKTILEELRIKQWQFEWNNRRHKQVDTQVLP